MDALEKELCQIMGWDREIGGPTPETLKEMGLEHLF
jgi:aldehyde:ferredoxin oxidoreductase